MIEITGDLFGHVGTANAICLTTNGFTKNNGECVMGKGCAKKATQYWPLIAKILGSSIEKNGNVVNLLGTVDGTNILSFPVKPIADKFNGSNTVKHMLNKFKIGDRVPGWACVADISLIEESAIQLAHIANYSGWPKIILPRPGCGAGELNWMDVKSVLDEHLDDRFYSITFN